MARQALRLIDTDPGAPAQEQTPTERVFGHWVWMLNKPRTRTALGPTRKRAIEKALELYDEDVLMMAIEGCAASRWHAGDNDRGKTYNDLELILRDEARIERFAELGEQVRQRALREASAQRQAAAAEPAAAPDAALILAERERVRALAARLAGRQMPAHG